MSGFGYLSKILLRSDGKTSGTGSRIVSFFERTALSIHGSDYVFSDGWQSLVALVYFHRLHGVQAIQERVALDFGGDHFVDFD